MLAKRYLPAPEILSWDQRCSRCRNGLDRIGRYCRRCMKAQQVKATIGSLAVVQIAAAGFFAFHNVTFTRPGIVSSDGVQIVPVTPPPGTAGWAYYDVVDSLIDDTTHHARLASNGAVAPVPGAMAGTLDIAVSRHYGTNIVLTLPSLPRHCGADAPEKCHVMAIFDQLAPRRLDLRDVSDGGGTVLMLAGDPGFVDALRAAHDLTLVASLGTGHDAVVTFGVAGLRMQLADLQERVRTAG